MSDHNNAPRVKLTELREYESERTGRTYFAGYLGGTRVVMLRDDRAEITGKEKARWTVFLEEAPPREAKQQPAPQRAAPSAKRQTRTSAPDPARQAARKAADRRAEASMRDRGLDPHAPMSSDPLPF